MIKLNNTRILLAILALLVFIIFVVLIIYICSATYFTNLRYVGFQHDSTQTGKYRITYMFSEYGQVQTTIQYPDNSLYEVSYGTYEFHNDEEPSFEINRWLNSLRYINAFQLETANTVYTNISAVCLLVFYLIIAISSLVCTIILLITCKKGKPLFGRTKRLEARIVELEQQIEKLNNDE